MIQSQRPTVNHSTVKERAASKIIDDVILWRNTDKPSDEVRVLVTLAVQECDDAFFAAMYLQEIGGWPVNIDLVKILDTAYSSRLIFTKELVKEWVMENKVRLPYKPGDRVYGKIGKLPVTVQVTDVNKTEACCYGLVLPRKTKTIRLNAEEIVGSVASVSKQPNPSVVPM